MGNFFFCWINIIIEQVAFRHTKNGRRKRQMEQTIRILSEAFEVFQSLVADMDAPEEYASTHDSSPVMHSDMTRYLTVARIVLLSLWHWPKYLFKFMVYSSPQSPSVTRQLCDGQSESWMIFYLSLQNT